MRYFLFLFCFWCFGIVGHAKEEPENLHAQSAVLMDAESGRVLFEVKGEEQKAMASTTKIMTCILALEYGNATDIVKFSEYAASQPEVHLGAESGSSFLLEDLLYSLMLESHNDTAVAIAEHISGSVEAFAERMNEKAEKIGCEQTNFVTPNGLDGKNETGNHVTTAEDLALIMRYCIMDSPMKTEFLKITQKQEHSFSDVENKSSYSCVNHNAFLNMMDGALTGKTGYTSKAGYCYVGALENEGRTFIVSLLACGWPNHKNYKWEDMKQLMNYALDTYHYETVELSDVIAGLTVQNSRSADGLHENLTIQPAIQEDLQRKGYTLLLGEEEKAELLFEEIPDLTAPVLKGSKVGEISVMVDGEKVDEIDVVSQDEVEERNYEWYLSCLTKMFFVKNMSKK